MGLSREPLNKGFGGINMTKECLWYDGVEGCYHLLDFDPHGLKGWQIAENARKELQKSFDLDGDELEKAMETIYLIDVENLEEVKGNE